MRVGLVSGGVFGTHSIGGAERQTGELAKLLAKRGHDVSLVARASDQEIGTSLSDSVDLDFYVARGTNRLGWTDAIEESLGRVAPDVIYQRGLAVQTIASSRYAERVGCGFVFAAASDGDADTIGVRFLRGFRERRAESEQKGWLRSVVGALLDVRVHMTLTAAARTADILVAQSEGQRRLLERRFGAHGCRITMIRSVFPDVQETVPSDQCDLVLWVGADKPVKRPWLFARIADKGPAEFRYLMVGTRIRSGGRYQSTATETLDALSPAEVVRLMQEAIVLVNTSATEGFPNTYMEAWVCGTPVLNLGIDPDEVVAREGLGWTCNGMEECREVLEEISRDRTIAVRAGERCHEYAVKRSNTADIEEALERVLEDACTIALEKHRTQS